MKWLHKRPRDAKFLFSLHRGSRQWNLACSSFVEYVGLDTFGVVAWALLRGCGAGVAGVGWGGDGGGEVGGRGKLVHLGASGDDKAPFLPVLRSAASVSTDEKAREEGEARGKGDAGGAAGEA